MLYFVSHAANRHRLGSGDCARPRRVCGRQREAIGDKFPKHIYHSIVCIGALIAHREPDHWAVDTIGAPHVGERTEKQLISAFCDKIAALSPQLVTFNGHSFDLPVLRYRAMVHGVSAPGLSSRPYFHRFSEDAVDLCDVFSSFSPQGKATLHEISRVMGLPGKPKGFDGSEVERYFREGKIKEIADYCETDVISTYQLWLRYELFRGRLVRMRLRRAREIWRISWVRATTWSGRHDRA